MPILVPLVAAAAAADPHPTVIKPVTPPPTLAIPPKPPPPTVTVIRNAEWAVRPSGEDFARYFPEGAQRAGQGGHATLSCVVTVEGRLSPCEVVEETPPGLGFGEASLKMAPLWQMRPKTVNGAPQESTVRIPLTFATPPPYEPPPPTDGPPPPVPAPRSN